MLVVVPKFFSASKELLTFSTGTARWTVHWTVQAAGSTWQLGFHRVCCWYSGQRLWRCHYLQQYDTHLCDSFVLCWLYQRCFL